MSKRHHSSGDPSRGHSAGSVAEPVGGFTLGPGFLERVATLEAEIAGLRNDNARVGRLLAVTRGELSAALRRIDRLEHPNLGKDAP